MPEDDRHELLTRAAGLPTEARRAKVGDYLLRGVLFEGGLLIPLSLTLSHWERAPREESKITMPKTGSAYPPTRRFAPPSPVPRERVFVRRITNEPMPKRGSRGMSFENDVPWAIMRSNANKPSRRRAPPVWSDTF